MSSASEVLVKKRSESNSALALATCSTIGWAALSANFNNPWPSVFQVGSVAVPTNYKVLVVRVSHGAYLMTLDSTMWMNILIKVSLTSS